MLYNRDPATPLVLLDNLRYGNTLPPSLIVVSMTIDDRAAKMENIYQSVLPKAHTL